MMAVSFLPIMSESDGVTNGDGTAENPYSGTITELDEFAYYTLGTEFDVYVGMKSESTLWFYDSYEVSGLYIENGYLKGMIEATGIFWVEDYTKSRSGTTCMILVPHVWEVWDGYGVVNTSVAPMAGVLDDLILYGNGGMMNLRFEDLGFGMSEDGGTGALADGGIRNEDGYWVLTLHRPLVKGVHTIWSDIGRLPQELSTAVISVTDIDYDNKTVEIVVNLEFIASSWVPTFFVSEGSFVGRITEIAEIYDEEYTPDIPTVTRDGYTFTGWYEDPECTIPWEFMTTQDWLDLGGDFSSMNPVRVLYAGWEPDPSAIPELEFTSDPSGGDIEYVG